MEIATNELDVLCCFRHTPRRSAYQTQHQYREQICQNVSLNYEETGSIPSSLQPTG